MKNKKKFLSQYTDLMKEWDYGKNKDLDPEKLTYGSNRRVWWECNKCRYNWKTTINNRIGLGNNCPACCGQKVKFNGSNSLATMFPYLLKEWDYKKNKDLDPKKITYGSRKKVFWVCSKCRYEWKTIICNRTGLKNNCPACCNRKIKSNKSNSFGHCYPDLLKEWDYNKNTNLDPEKLTIGSHKVVWWKCLKCEYEWKAMVKSRVKGNKCPASINLAIKPNKSNSFAYCYPKLLKEWDYSKNINLDPEKLTPGLGKKVFWVCLRCNYKWEATIHSRTNLKCGCPQCKESKGEKRIRNYLIKKEIPYIYDKSYANCINPETNRKLKWDFRLYKNNNILIEYQGIQHYKCREFFGGEKTFIQQQKLDKIKEKYAKDNNIKLIVIPHWEKDNIEKILDKEIPN